MHVLVARRQMHAGHTNDDDNDPDLQAALALSMAFQVEELLRSTAEPLPLRRHNGQGIVWQSELLLLPNSA